MPSSLSSAPRLWLLLLLLCGAQGGHALVHHDAEGGGSRHGAAAALSPGGAAPLRRRGGEIAGWTKILSCIDQSATDRMLFTAAEIQDMAASATRVKYCLYGSTTNCLTSLANTFPVTSVRQGAPTSHNNGSPCGTACVRNNWEDDDPSNGLAVPGDLWTNCGSWSSGSWTGTSMVHHACNNGNGLHVAVNDGGRCCFKSGDCYQGSENEAGVEMYLDIAAPSAPPTSAPLPATAAMAPSSFGDPHVSNLRGEKFDILSPGHFVYLSIPRGATAAAGSGALLRIVATVEPLGRLCQERLLFVTGLDLSGQWVLGGRVRSLSLSTTVQAKMGAQALRISVLPVPLASLGNGTSGGSETVARDLNASELATEFGRAGLLELTDYEPKALPGAVNQHVAVLLLKFQLGPTIAKIRMVQQREKDEEGPYQEAWEENEAGKGKHRFSNSLWLTVTGLEKVLKGEGAADIGGILGFDDHRSATLPPQECNGMLQMEKQRLERSAGGGGVHATVSLGHGAPPDDDLI